MKEDLIRKTKEGGLTRDYMEKVVGSAKSSVTRTEDMVWNNERSRSGSVCRDNDYRYDLLGHAQKLFSLKDLI